MVTPKIKYILKTHFLFKEIKNLKNVFIKTVTNKQNYSNQTQKSSVKLLS